MLLVVIASVLAIETLAFLFLVFVPRLRYDRRAAIRVRELARSESDEPALSRD